jgi:hypothetical protein
MDYLYSRVRDASFVINTVERIAFKEHLEKIASALHDIEWVDSSDSSEGSENDAIRACLSSTATLDVAIAQAYKAKDDLIAEIERSKK